MANLTKVYAENINSQYPIAGKSNNSQGFRDNFKNIFQSLVAADNDISDLQRSTVKIGQEIYPSGSFLPKIKTDVLIANVAMYPESFTATIVSALSSDPKGTIASIFSVTSVNNIFPGATVNFSNTWTTYTVDYIDETTNRVATTQPFTVGIGDTAYFNNPYFKDIPVSVRLTTLASNTSTGRVDRTKGTIYASPTELEVQFDDYGGVGSSATNNTFRISTTGNNANIDVTNNSNDLASTGFVHNILPYGSVVMWYGRRSKIPTGWLICDGTNGTPDLRNKFVVGADGDYSPTGTFQSPGSSISGAFSATGGSSLFDFSKVPAHSHFASFTGIPTSHSHSINDPGHFHYFYNLVGADANNGGANGVQYGTLSVPTTSALTGVTVLSTATTALGTVTVEATGTTYSNTQIIPPFAAVYYIMKVTGVNLTT
jgi:hypothetical protein